MSKLMTHKRAELMRIERRQLDANRQWFIENCLKPLWPELMGVTAPDVTFVPADEEWMDPRKRSE